MQQQWSSSGSLTRKLKGDWWKAKLCTSCVSPLGRILSRGGHCPQCGLRVCKNCRFYDLPNKSQVTVGQNSPAWICILCSGTAPNYATLPKSTSIGKTTKSIRRSWTISNPQRGQNNSPILKSYVIFNDDNTTTSSATAHTRQFNSLPRLSYGIQDENHHPLDSPFSYSTLYTFKTNKATSTTSVNFIEDPFWDYYDYNVINSNRSSCERSLGETESYTYIIDPSATTDDPKQQQPPQHRRLSQQNNVPPVKPERTHNKRSNSLNSYDGKKLSFSPLRTYVVLRQPQNPNNPVAVTKKRSSSFNLDYSDTKRNRGGGGGNAVENSEIFSELKRPLSEHQLNIRERASNNVRRNSSDKLQPVLLIGEKSRPELVRDENRLNSPELNTLFSSQSLPKRKSTTHHQFLSDFLRESSDSAPKLAKYFHHNPNDSESSTVPRSKVVIKPPRKYPFPTIISNQQQAQPPLSPLMKECELNRGEPIDPKLENLLRKSEKILNPNINIVKIEHEYQTFPRRKHLTTVPVVQDHDINTHSLDRKYPQNIYRINNTVTDDKSGKEAQSSSGSSSEDLIAQVLTATDSEGEEEEEDDDHVGEVDEGRNEKAQALYNKNINSSVVTVGGGWVYRAQPPSSTSSAALVPSTTAPPAQPSEQVSNEIVGPKERRRRRQPLQLLQQQPNRHNKLTDLNSQYAPNYGLKEGNYPGSPRPSSSFGNLRIIKGRSSNEFVTTVQINNDMCHEPIIVNPILRIQDDGALTPIRQLPLLHQDQQVALDSEVPLVNALSAPTYSSHRHRTTTLENETNEQAHVNILTHQIIPPVKQHSVECANNSEPPSSPSSSDPNNYYQQSSSSTGNSSDDTIIDLFQSSQAHKNSNVISSADNGDTESVTETLVGSETIEEVYVDTEANNSSDANNTIIVQQEQIREPTSVAEKIKELIFGDSESLIIPEDASEKASAETFQQLLDDLHETLKTDLVTRKLDQESEVTASHPGIYEQVPPSNAPSVISVSSSDLREKTVGISEVTPNILDCFEGSTCGSENSEDLLQYLHALETRKPATTDLIITSEAELNTEVLPHSLSSVECPPEAVLSTEDISIRSDSTTPECIIEESISKIRKPETMMEHNERLTPEGQESFTDESTTTKRSSPDGEAIHDIKSNKMEEESFQVTSSDSDNSWVEEIPYEEGPPPLDLTLHTIVEESCEESCDESLHSLHITTRKAPHSDALENYFNYLDPAQQEAAEMQQRRLVNEDSEFSDTFSESSFNSEVIPPHEEDSLMDPVDLASTRLEKYFTNLSYDNSAEQYSEDSVGSESECDDHVKDKKKKVLKHKRSANVSDDESIFDQDEGAFDTIKKVSKKKQQEKPSEPDSSSAPSAKAEVQQNADQPHKPKQILLDRSNSFQWSSDEEVNLMMSKLRHLIKNLMQKSQTAPSESNSQLRYFETELIRLMRAEPELKNIVSEYISSEESDDNEFNQFIKDVVTQQESQEPAEKWDPTRQRRDLGSLGQNNSPALIAKVMHHIGNRLSVWMKDEEEEGSLKCAPSVSSDLNEDRFSWKGSFESTLAAKRQSVGSTDSISSSDLNSHPASSGVDRSILRSSSLHHLANSQPIEEKKEEEENISSSLPKLNQVANMSRAQSLIGIKEKVKSARYRPPGFTQAPNIIKQIDDKMSMSTPALHQDNNNHASDSLMNLRSSADSISSIFENSIGRISIRGQIEFGLQYNYKLASLEVRVKQCKDLAAVDTKRNRSDPYVKAYLLPDRSKSGKRKTKTKKNTLNPVFEETLKFPVSLSELQGRTLWLSVWHNDIFGKNEFLGQVIVNLKDRVFDDPSPVWWSLEEMSVQADDQPVGDLVIALKWQPRSQNAGNLSVLVKEAKNLLPTKNGCPSTFVKCCPLKESKYHRMKQKTNVARRTLHPIWNQTLYFEDIPDDGIEVSLWSHDLLSNHDLIGTVKLDVDNPLWESMLNRHSFWVEGGLKLEHPQQSP